MASVRLVTVLFTLALSACALRPPQPVPDLNGQCEHYYRAMDDTVARHAAGDAGAWRLPGYPHLRSTRFLAAFRERALDAEQTRDWLQHLQTVDRDARSLELARLPAAARDALLAHAPFDAAHAAALARCAEVLIERDLAHPERLASIRIRSRVPDHYRDWRRILGVYPVSQLIARSAINSLHERLAAEFESPLETLPVQGELHRYTPPAAPALAPAALAGILREARDNPLHIPRPGPAQRRQLLNYYAPIWEFDQLTDDDWIGAIRYDADRRAHYVDTAAPVVYQWISHTLFHAEPLLQLNYLVWLPARTAQSATDIYAGAFDGLIWRVTLLPDGTPLAFDSVHPCGCYYLLFTGERSAARETGNVAEPVLNPQRLPALRPGQRLVVRARAGDHYIQRVYPDRAGRGTVYRMTGYADLLATPGDDGRAHNLFDETGLLGASARPERYLLWPFGIVSPGAMRQAGTLAIAFVGVRHFDDARLLEQLIELIE